MWTSATGHDKFICELSFVQNTRLIVAVKAYAYHHGGFEFGLVYIGISVILELFGI